MMASQPLKALVMAGGTGGHVFPALAVAEELSARAISVEWLGTARGIEAKLVPAANIVLHTIDVTGLRGKGVGKLLTAPFLLLKALWQAIGVVRQQKPDIVLGFGGFASGPGGLAAYLLRKPLVIHEQNAVAGTTNRLLARMASRVLSAFPQVFVTAEQVGNPVRKEIPAAYVEPFGANDSGRPLRLLVLGGSLGAQAINTLVPDALALMASPNTIEVRHQAGAAHAEVSADHYKKLGLKAEISPFINDMAEAYAWSDLVICRAGALTVAELTAAGRASVLIPFPHAIDDHQTKNGEWLVANGAAELYPQSSLSPVKMQEIIETFMNDRNRLKLMGANAHDLALPDAAQQVADICMEIINA